MILLNRSIIYRLIPFTGLLILILNFYSNGQIPAWSWAKNAGGFGEDDARAMAIDALGNTYIAGYFTSTNMTLGPVVLSNHNTDNSQDIFIAKYDLAGNLIWAKSAGGLYHDGVMGIAIDANANLYITGYFTSWTVYFDSISLNNYSAIVTNNFEDFFIAKYDSSGNAVWARKAGGTGDDYGTGIAVDNSGDVIAVGVYGSTPATFGSISISPPFGNLSEVFMAKYSPSGNVIWLQAPQGWGGNSERFNDIVTDNNGNIYLTGHDNSINFGNNVIINISQMNDAFIVKYNSSGTALWARQIVGNGDEDYGANLSLDNAGYLFATGGFGYLSDTLFIGSTQLIRNSNHNLYISKWDAAGNFIWAINPIGDINSTNIEFDQGDLYITGFFSGVSAQFGSTLLTNFGSYDLYVAKYDASSNFIWATAVGGNNEDYAEGLSVYPITNSLTVCGYYKTPLLSFGSTSLFPFGDKDVFVAQLSSLTGLPLDKSEELNIFPNPTTIQFTIYDLRFTISNIEMYNMMGGKVFSELVSSNPKQVTIDVSSLTPGIYFITVTDENKRSLTRKIVKM